MLAEGKVGAWFQGRLEFGPRALGNRSILADPRPKDMQQRLNLRTKKRESFRPFAPSVPSEAVAQFFEDVHDSPYMLFTAKISRSKVAEARATGTRQRWPGSVHSVSEVPAVTHVDGSARLQTVQPKQNPRFWRLLTLFGEVTGCPMLVNTSFNLRGEPIVCSPADALASFMRSDIDFLVLGCHLLTRHDVRGADVNLSTVLEPD
jgi:carbamoyltransferase